MSTKIFFKAFLAALSLRGIHDIDTRENRHQIAFSRSLESFKRNMDDSNLPVLFPSLFTGTFAEWNRALIHNQIGNLTEAVGPCFSTVVITLSEERARIIFEELVPQNLQAAFMKAAWAF